MSAMEERKPYSKRIFKEMFMEKTSSNPLAGEKTGVQFKGLQT